MSAAQTRATLTSLVQLAQAAGVSYAGLRRDALFAALRSHAAAAHGLAAGPLRLRSLDIGYQCFAHAQVLLASPGARPVVERWDKIPVELPATHGPASFAQHMVRFVAERVLPTAEPSPAQTLLLFERQSFRGRGGTCAIPGGIQTLGRIETALHVLTCDRAVRTVDPRMVARTLGYDETGPAKKRCAVSLVREILAGVSVANHEGGSEPQMFKSMSPSVLPIVPAAMHAFFTNEKKKDDLADALLQALAFLQWQQTLREAIPKLCSEG